MRRDERASEIFPRAFAAVLRVRTTDGQLLEHRVDSSRGGPEHPLSRTDLLVKFRLNASRALPTVQVEALVECVDRLLIGGNAADLLGLTRADAVVRLPLTPQSESLEHDPARQGFR